jgi:hypothetical protein
VFLCLTSALFTVFLIITFILLKFLVPAAATFQLSGGAVAEDVLAAIHDPCLLSRLISGV